MNPPDYATLTNEQAKLIRALRTRMTEAADELAQLSGLLLNACPHIDPECPQTCYVCRLYRNLQDAAGELHDLPDVVERALVTGPDPRVAGRKPNG